MDISTVLNPLHEIDQQEPMEVDSATSTYYPAKNSQLTRVYPRRLPPIDNLSTTSVKAQALSYNSLPSLRFHFSDSLPPFFPDISPPYICKTEDLDYDSQMAIPEMQKKVCLKRQPSRIHHAQRVERISLYEYHVKSLQPDGISRLSRRQSHYSSSILPRSPRSPHHCIFRRGSHPPFVPSRRGLGDGYNSSPATASKMSNHNNEPYTREMIDWIRYHKVDRNMTWTNEMLPLFFKRFPERYRSDATGQALSSRYYRDNVRPVRDEQGKLCRDESDHIKLCEVKVRHQSTAEGRRVDFPNSLVDKWPARLLMYQWALEEDKERARQILKGDDPSDPQGKRAEWRYILNTIEDLLYKPEKLSG